MSAGEFATRITVWAALLLWLAAEWLALNPARLRLRQWIFGLSAIVFLGHVVLAFHIFYDWSQSTALADVRRQTREVTGLEWSIGLWINYAFALLWCGEALWLGLEARHYSGRPRWITLAVRGVFWFMAFNGAVVFVKGPQRWLGLAICLGAVGVWWTGWKRARAESGRLPTSSR